MKIIDASLVDIIPYARNPRKNDLAVDKVASSIKEFGFRQPIVVDDEKVIIAGHTRYLAAQKLGLDQVPIHIAEGLTAQQVKAYRIADNRVSQEAEWDLELLKLELPEIDGMFTGFDQDELDQLLAPEPTEGLTDEDAVPEIPEEPITVEGDIWILGNHRLMCGDSTSIDAVEILMGGQKADMVFTDPPYNVDYSGRGQNELGTIKNDNMSEADFEQFCRDVFSCYEAVMKPLACIYVCHPDAASATKLAFETTFAESFKKSATIIWMKQSAGMGWQDYRSQHEPILYGWKKGSGKHSFYGDRTKTTVWNIGRDAQMNYAHPTQKPVALSQEAILNSSKGEDHVLDLFAGSGSTLIAAEKCGRIGRMMELDPKYCDVIVKRWQEFTGKEAILENDNTRKVA